MSSRKSIRSTKSRSSKRSSKNKIRSQVKDLQEYSEVDEFTDYTLDNPLVAALIEKSATVERKLKASRRRALKAEATAQMALEAYRQLSPNSKNSKKKKKKKSKQKYRESSRLSRSKNSDIENDKRTRLWELERSTRELERELLRIKQNRKHPAPARFNQSRRDIMYAHNSANHRVGSYGRDGEEKIASEQLIDSSQEQVNRESELLHSLLSKEVCSNTNVIVLL